MCYDKMNQNDEEQFGANHSRTLFCYFCKIPFFIEIFLRCFLYHKFMPAPLAPILVYFMIFVQYYFSVN